MVPTCSSLAPLIFISEVAGAEYTQSQSVSSKRFKLCGIYQLGFDVSNFQWFE